MVKKALYTIIMTFLTLSAIAQDPTGARVMVGLNVGAGVSALMYDEANTGTGFTGGAEIGVFFTPNVGVAVGLGYTSYKSNVELNEAYSYDIAVSGADGDVVAKGKYDVSVEKWKEEQTAASIDIPLKVLFRVDMGGDKGLLIGAGLKYSLMRNGDYEVTDGTISASCRFEDDLNMKIPASETDLVHHNVGTINYRPKGVVDLKSGLAACLDFSILQGSGPVRFEYGLYGSYGLSDIVERKSNHVMDFNSGYTNVIRSSSVEKVVPVCLGVKIGIRFAM